MTTSTSASPLTTGSPAIVGSTVHTISTVDTNSAGTVEFTTTCGLDSFPGWTSAQVVAETAAHVRFMATRGGAITCETCAPHIP